MLWNPLYVSPTLYNITCMLPMMLMFAPEVEASASVWPTSILSSHASSSCAALPPSPHLSAICVIVLGLKLTATDFSLLHRSCRQFGIELGGCPVVGRVVARLSTVSLITVNGGSMEQHRRMYVFYRKQYAYRNTRTMFENFRTRAN